MRIHCYVGFVLASAAIVSLTGCATGGQAGPLQFGNDEGNVTSRLCGPNERGSQEVFYAQTASNPTGGDIEIVGVSLLDAPNVTQTADLATVINEPGETVFYIHFEDPADPDDVGSRALIDRMQPAKGFSIPANATVLLSAQAKFEDPESEASVLQMAVEYKAGGRNFFEKGSMSWQTNSSGCGQ